MGHDESSSGVAMQTHDGEDSMHLLTSQVDPNRSVVPIECSL